MASGAEAVPRTGSDGAAEAGGAGKVPLGRSRSAGPKAGDGRPGLHRVPSWSRIPESWKAAAAAAEGSGDFARQASATAVSAASSASGASAASALGAAHGSPASAPASLFSPGRPASSAAGSPDPTSRTLFAPSLPPGFGSELGLSPELFLAVDAYFSEVYPMWPIIHRPTFETALRGSSPIYRRPPLMLALALAACGARVLPHASSAYRAQASYEWAESARRELLARAEDDLESAQAFTILLDVYSPAGVPGLCYALVKRAATAAEQLRALIAVTSPRTVTEWLFRELVTRLRIFLVSYDLAVSVQTGKPTFGCYFHNHALALPCSEAYFDDPDPVRAFSALQVRWAASPTHSVPVVHLGEPTIESIVKAFQDFAAVPFGGGGSVLALFLMSNFSRHILMTTVRSDPGPSGILRKQAVAMLSVLGESTLKVLPRKVADALAAGDPGPILANWEEFFPQQAIAHTAVQMLLAQDSYSIDRLLVGGFRSAARMRCLTFCGVVRGLVRADRAFRWSHFMLAPPAFKVGVELVAAVVAERGEQIGETPEQRAAREQRACEYEAGVQTVGSCLDALARKYGMEIRRFADLFHEHAEGYGVRIERRVAAPLDAVDPPFREVENAEGWAPFFWDRLFRDGLESVLLGGIPKDLWGNAVSPKAQAGSLVGSPTPSVGSLLNGDSRSL